MAAWEEAFHQLFFPLLKPQSPAIASSETNQHKAMLLQPPPLLLSKDLERF